MTLIALFWLALKVIVSMLVVIAVIAAVVWAIDHQQCPDSPTGEHEDFPERTEFGTVARCQWCARMTSGITARWG